MSSSRVRIDLPNKVDDIIKLAKAFSDKHTELAAASPLTGLKWTKITPAVATADAAHKDAKRFSAQAEAATETRDTALEDVNVFIRASRDILSGVHAEEMRKLGDYGFAVNATAPAARKATTVPA